jgi:multiple sugar transport system permease protein
VRRKTRRMFRKIVTYVLAIGFLGIMLTPIIWMGVCSLAGQIELRQRPPRFPQKLTLDNYLFVLGLGRMGGMMGAWGGNATVVSTGFVTSYGNSIIIATSVTVLSLVLACVTAYPLVFMKMRGRRPVFFLFMTIQLLPSMSILIPLYIFFRQLGLIDTYLGIVAAHSSFILPFAIWLMSSFLSTIPKEMEEAALIDGCSRRAVLVRIILPLSVGAIATTAVFCFLSSWNEFLFTLMLTGAQTKPVIRAIAEFVGHYGVDYALYMTAGMLASIPAIVLALAFQKFIIKGLLSGAVKG